MHGPHWYLNGSHFSDPIKHSEFLNEVQHETNRSRDLFIDHYRTKYSSPNLPPSWMIGEILSFGAWSRTYKHLTAPNKKAIAVHFGIHEVVCTSWSHSISVLRNLCAHHSRLYNRVFTVSPKLASSILSMNQMNSRTYYAQAAVIQAFHRVIAPGSNWPKHLRDLLEANPHIASNRLGFPSNWTQDPFWGFS
jgi:abortive infection bacteriophage resistance protein